MIPGITDVPQEDGVHFDVRGRMGNAKGSGRDREACLPSVLGIQYDLGYKGRVRITIKQSFRFGSCGGALNSRGAHEDEATVILQFSMNKIATNE